MGCFCNISCCLPLYSGCNTNVMFLLLTWDDTTTLWSRTKTLAMMRSALDVAVSNRACAYANHGVSFTIAHQPVSSGRVDTVEIDRRLATASADTRP